MPTYAEIEAQLTRIEDAILSLMRSGDLAIKTSSGIVTSISTGTGLTGGPITSIGTISLANTAVTAGSYTLASITVDATGRLTAASSGSVSLDGLSDVNTTGVGTGDVIYKSAGDWVDYPLSVGSALRAEDGGFEFGAASDYTRINQTTGTLTLHGAATVFNDLLQSLLVQGLNNPSADLTINYAEGTLDFDSDSGLSDYAVMNVQMGHNWKIGSNIYPHVHWFQASANVPNWMIQYRWQQQGAAKTTSWTSAKYTTHAFTYTSGTLNQISAFGAITPPVGAGLSDIVQFRLIRDTNNDSTLFSGTDPLAGDAQAINFDVHYEIDSLGSNEEYTK